MMFSVTLSSEDGRLLAQVEKYGLSKGVLSGGIVEEKVLDVGLDENEEEKLPTFQGVVQHLEKEVPYSQRDTTFYEVYGIMRQGQLGYIGVTSAGAARRIAAHLKKAELAQDPFVQWLKEGLESKDIDAGVIKTSLGYSEAHREEKRLIHKLHPLFNKQDGEYGLVNKIGGLKQMQLEGPDSE